MQGTKLVFFFFLLTVNFVPGFQYGTLIRNLRVNQAKVMRKYMDPLANPCDDFYQYACGKWHLFNPIPDDRNKIDVLDILHIQASLTLKALLESRSSEREKTPDDAIWKAKDFYASCMNITEIERRGNEPLVEFLRQLGGWPAIEKNWTNETYNWIDTLALTRQLDERIIFDSYVYEDIRNTAENMLYIDEPYLGLGPPPGNRDFFLNDTNMLAAYRTLISDTLTILGANETVIGLEVEDIISFETALANISSSVHDRSDLNGRYTRMTLHDLTNSFPNIEWERYFSHVHERHMSTSEPIVVMAKRFAAQLSDLIGRTDTRTIANYILWRIVQKMAPHLGSNFENIFQKFYLATEGSIADPQRWEKCVQNAIEVMDMATGALYVQSSFRMSTTINMENMFIRLKRAFQEILRKKDWLDSSTRILAEEKLEAMKIRVGYPELMSNPTQLRDHYKTVSINQSDYFGNMLNLYQLKSKEQTLKIGKRVNKNEWTLHPTDAQVLYEYAKQQVFVAAAILNLPFYHRHLPQFLNYAGIGVVAAHDMSHGLDDKGANFDSFGNLRKWWSSSSVEAYTRRANCIINQYNGYSINGTNIPGKLVQAEALADNAGLKIAFSAYKKWVLENKNNNNVAGENLPGFNMTREQLFFLSFAQHQCASIRPEAVSYILQTNMHPTGRYRVNGPLANSKGFAGAFNCSLGQNMNPETKCRVW